MRQIEASDHEEVFVQHSFPEQLAPSLSTSGATLTIEELLTLRARTETVGHVGDEHEWSWVSG